MRTFNIPFEVQEEDKIFGGYLSIRQVLYLFIAALGIRLFWVPVPFVLRIAGFVAVAGIMLAFAFLKVNGVQFDLYTLTWAKFHLRKKRYFFGEEKS